LTHSIRRDVGLVSPSFSESDDLTPQRFDVQNLDDEHRVFKDFFLTHNFSLIQTNA